MGIRTKIFLLIFVIFVLLFGTMLISPSFLFKQYYVLQKIKDVSKATNQFAHKQLEGSIDKDVLQAATYEFSKANDVYLQVFEKNGASLLANKYDFEVEAEATGKMEILLTQYMLYANEFESMNIQVGDQLWISGYIFEKGRMYPTIINERHLYGDNLEDLKAQYGKNINYGNSISLEVTVTQYVIPPKIEGASYKEKILTEMNSRYLKEMIESQKIDDNMTMYQHEDRSTGITNYAILKVIDRYYIIVILSLQPQNDIGQYVAGYMRYIAIAGIFLLILLALAISRIISKPLIHINELARQMAEMNFSKKIPVRSKDEMGLLSESLNKMSTELEKTLSDLNQANKKLLLDVEKGKQIEKMRKDFIANASHELKTPLGIIRAFTERIQDYFLTHEINEDMIESTSIILDESKRMDKLIMDMNELSKLESMTINVSKEECNLNALVEKVIDKFAILIEEKEITLQMAFYKNKTLLMADFDKLEQVMMNFVSNAIRYTPDHGYIRVLINQDQGQGIRFSIENSCDDIGTKELNMLWDRFYRIDKSRSRKLGGTGIGLAIVKVILELHDFKYGVTKVEGGIKFWFVTQ